MNAILRRTLGSDAGDVMEAGGITIDKAAHIVKIDGKPIELSYKEFELLTYLWRIAELHCQEKRSLIMYGIMIILEMQGRLIRM